MTRRQRRDAGAVERGGLENRCGGDPTQGSNPCLSANHPCFNSLFCDDFSIPAIIPAIRDAPHCIGVRPRQTLIESAAVLERRRLLSLLQQFK